MFKLSPKVRAAGFLRFYESAYINIADKVSSVKDYFFSTYEGAGLRAMKISDINERNVFIFVDQLVDFFPL
jgi:hypothetical protein